MRMNHKEQNFPVAPQQQCFFLRDVPLLRVLPQKLDYIHDAELLCQDIEIV